ncbi:mitofusin-2-like, partial [Anneissia japonica]|uniref:mitofusin-2-like n=1 Tax=Anneissia japonica TaxID=1529436 RepID=UPI0014256BCD
MPPPHYPLQFLPPHHCQILLPPYHCQLQLLPPHHYQHPAMLPQSIICSCLLYIKSPVLPHVPFVNTIVKLHPECGATSVLKITRLCFEHKGGALAEGFQARLFEFENFERKFEECISKSALITKFEQHSRQGQQITQEIQALMESLYEKAARRRALCIEKRKEKGDMLDHIIKQLGILTTECKDKIKDISEQAEYKISSAMTEEIRRLHILVDQFDRPFHPDALVIKVYKE